MSRPSDVIDGVLPPARGRPVRLYSLVYTGGYLAEWLLDVREWHSECHWAEPVRHLYAAQRLDDADPVSGDVWGLVRLSPLPESVREFDDGGDGCERLFRVLVPHRSCDRGQCDCKAWRIRRQCRHLAALTDARRTQRSEPVG